MHGRDLSDSALHARLTAQSADAILRSFEDYHDRFRSTTRRTKSRFERSDWLGIRRDTVERFHLHPAALASALSRLRELLGPDLDDRAAWHEIKVAYHEAILGRDDFELAQTFFNSLTRRLFPHVGVDPRVDFVGTDFPLPWTGWEMAAARTYSIRSVTAAAVRRILTDADFRVPFDDLDGTSERVAGQAQAVVATQFEGPIDALDVLRPIFVRNKGAYVVGRVRQGDRVEPLLLALLNDDGRLDVDAVIQTEDEASIVFSFARWYFSADVETPRAVIGFLHSILPRKRIAELYISLGYSKHGKTELYQDLMTQVETTQEQFVVAPGQLGLVMAVFTLPSYEFVFKVIRDRFPPQKAASRSEIMERYRHVLLTDRVGRLVDFQEFEDLALPRERFSETLLGDLVSAAGQTVSVEGDRVIVRHAYVGRRVRPLDLYLREVSPELAQAAVVEWGQALKDLAAADIFAGDMLAKNFGVTRHRRVVFYDYDELQPLTECRFRRVPESRDPWDDVTSAPWFSVGRNDVFPEEFERFLGLPPDLHDLFVEHHGDLFTVDYWRGLQERIRGGELVDFFPYARTVALNPPGGP